MNGRRTFDWGRAIAFFKARAAGLERSIFAERKRVEMLSPTNYKRKKEKPATDRDCYLGDERYDVIGFIRRTRVNASEGVGLELRGLEEVGNEGQACHPL